MVPPLPWMDIVMSASVSARSHSSLTFVAEVLSVLIVL